MFYVCTNVHQYRLPDQIISNSKNWKKISFGFKYNVDKFTTYISVLLIQLENAGGSNAQLFDKSYASLTHTPCNIFNSKIVAYKSIHSNRNTINVNTLLVNHEKSTAPLL